MVTTVERTAPLRAHRRTERDRLRPTINSSSARSRCRVGPHLSPHLSVEAYRFRGHSNYELCRI
jgi:hypothetical protein